MTSGTDPEVKHEGSHILIDKIELKEVKEKASLCDDLCKILLDHVGEDGDNEGAVDCLNRLSGKARKWDKINKEPYHENTALALEQEIEKGKQTQKLRKLIEKLDWIIIIVALTEYINLKPEWDEVKSTEQTARIIQKLLEEYKK